MSSESGSVETAAAKAKEKVARASDDYYIDKLQRLPPIKPPSVSESLFQVFPRLRELLRAGVAAVKSLIRMEEEIARQYRKILAYDDGHRQDPPGRRYDRK